MSELPADGVGIPVYIVSLRCTTSTLIRNVDDPGPDELRLGGITCSKNRFRLV